MNEMQNSYIRWIFHTRIVPISEPSMRKYRRYKKSTQWMNIAGRHLCVTDFTVDCRVNLSPTTKYDDFFFRNSEDKLTVWIIGAGIWGVFIIRCARRWADSTSTSTTSVSDQSQPQMLGHFRMIGLMDIVEDAAAGHLHLK